MKKNNVRKMWNSLGFNTDDNTALFNMDKADFARFVRFIADDPEYNQDTREGGVAVVSGNGDYMVSAFLEKVTEEDDVPNVRKGTRHPSTRQERRKKTAHAKQRKAKTIPYKRYSLDWFDWSHNRPVVESRTEEKLASELRDWEIEISTIPEEVEYYDEEDDFIDELFAEMRELKEKLEEKEAFIRFLQSQF